jgi:hypothetical protein
MAELPKDNAFGLLGFLFCERGEIFQNPSNGF